MALLQLWNLQGQGLVSVGWFSLKLEEWILLGLMVTATCVYPRACTNISPPLPSSPLSVSKLTFCTRIPVFGLGLTLSTVAEPHLHLEWPFPNKVTS